MYLSLQLILLFLIFLLILHIFRVVVHVAILKDVYGNWVPAGRIITSNLWSAEITKLTADAFLAQVRHLLAVHPAPPARAPPLPLA